MSAIPPLSGDKQTSGKRAKATRLTRGGHCRSASRLDRVDHCIPRNVTGDLAKCKIVERILPGGVGRKREQNVTIVDGMEGMNGTGHRSVDLPCKLVQRESHDLPIDDKCGDRRISSSGPR